jgi:xanthine dehydrogenase YagT iron-sulfur-binding subunit
LFYFTRCPLIVSISLISTKENSVKKEKENDDKKNETRNNASSRGLTRRGFLTSLGAGAVTFAVSDKVHATSAADAEMTERGEMTKVVLHINGRNYRLLVEPRWSLLYVLREQLGLSGTKVACERGECGSCTVLIDDVPRYACMTLAVEAEGERITTLEGLMKDEGLGPVQQAFVEEDAFQCGYCTPGQIMAVEGLLRKNPHPTIEEIRHGMSGNLCRCGAYKHITNAARKAAELRK